MLSPHDLLNIRQEAWDNRAAYREVLLVYPVVTSGSNYEPFTDSPYDITGAESGQRTVTFETYRAKARTKIIEETALAFLNQPVPGLEVGDYLLYFSERDRGMVDRLLPADPNSYLHVDGVNLKPAASSLNGVGRAFDVVVHCKRFSPRYRMPGT